MLSSDNTSQDRGLRYTFTKCSSKLYCKLFLTFYELNGKTAFLHGYELSGKTAFLHGILKEDIYVEVPTGMRYPPGTILRLLQSLYGLN